jgi:hypothetical protein
MITTVTWHPQIDSPVWALASTTVRILFTACTTLEGASGADNVDKLSRVVYHQTRMNHVESVAYLKYDTIDRVT